MLINDFEAGNFVHVCNYRIIVVFWQISFIKGWNGSELTKLDFSKNSQPSFMSL